MNIAMEIGPGLLEEDDVYNLEVALQSLAPVNPEDYRMSLIKTQTAEDIDKGFAYVEKRKSSCFRIFHNDFAVPVHIDTLMIVFARSGHGKSTFANHVAAKALMEGKRVCLFSNELDMYSYLYMVSAIIARMKGITNIREVANSIVGNFIVYDTTTSMGGTTYWDSVADYIIQMTKHHNPHIVLFDQLSNAGNTFNPENAKTLNIRDAFKQIKFITTRFQTMCNQQMELPPIITFQQGYAPDVRRHPQNWDAHTVARNGRGAIEDATHVLILGRKDNCTFIKCDKFRYPQIAYAVVSGFKYDSQLERFDTIEVPDDWSKLGKKEEEKNDANSKKKR